jgi:spermidine synthase
MNDINAAALPVASRRFYPIVLCFFIGSGAAALVYEIVWFQLLELVIGSSAISLAVLLATFMGGMCLGSIAFARVVPASWHPLRVYAAMELGIGVIAILVLYCLPYASDWYVSVAGYGFSGLFFRALLCIAFLLPPTVLMGATLPCAARWVERTPHGVSWLGILYTANLAGAVFGCLLAGFYLLRLYDMATATFVAAAINALCAVLALLLAAVASHDAAAARTSSGPVPLRADSIAVYLTIALSGLTALGAQVVWTRLLSLLLGTSVYTFSIILAVFLLGLGLGSSAGAFIAPKKDPQVALGWSQALLVLAIGWAGVSIGAWLPFWPVNPLLSVDPWITFQIDLVRVLWAVLPGACMWGASFPLALAAAAPHHEDTGRAVGAVYAANTVGAIVGALTFSMILIPKVGTLWSQRILMAVAALAAIVMIAASLRGAIAAGRKMPLVVRAGALAAIPIVTVLLGFGLPSVPGELFAYGRKVMAPEYELEMLYVGEGMNASIAVSRREDGARSFHVSGKTEATSDPVDMRLQRMLGHWSVLLHPKPRSVLIVGFGAGVTAGSFVTYPEIERIVICEIEPLIPQKIAGYFSKENYDVLKDPRVEVVYDDARHFVLTSKEKFDIITTDPIHPWVKGAATLYTREFFDLTRRHLKPGGVMTQWVPLYESTPEVVKSEMATFFSVFPEGLAWINDRDGGGDVVLFGQADPAPITFADIDRRLRRPENERAAQSMRDVGFESGMDVLASYAGRNADLKGWLKGAAINTDRDLRLQYLAGMGVNVSAQEQIYNELVEARRFPDGLFIASPETLSMLRDMIENREPEPDAKK